ncbi:MAG TPA: hypothetical protein VKZ67_08990 [Natronosporangium sp.]|nr:hypothetical protein [Natronosporangium sp.]
MSRPTPSPLWIRLLVLQAGLWLFGISVAMMVRANLGLASWDVLHEGIAARTGLPFGWVVIGVAALVMLAWVPLRQRPGIGTVCNVIQIGLGAELGLWLLPETDGLPARAVLLLAGVGLNGVATSLYIGAGFGPGPRDGLMTGLAARGYSIRLVRTTIELTVLAAGWLLGGTVGMGTLLYALTIGPIVHATLPQVTRRLRTST